MRLADLQHYPPTWRGHTGMLPEDQELWYQYLDNYPQTFSILWYNVRLLTDPTSPIDTDTKYIKLWQSLTARRCDVIAHSAHRRVIIEVATRLQPANIGRLLAYRTLWSDSYPNDPITHQAILYRYALEPELTIAKLQGWILMDATALNLAGPKN